MHNRSTNTEGAGGSEAVRCQTKASPVVSELLKSPSPRSNGCRLKPRRRLLRGALGRRKCRIQANLLSFDREGSIPCHQEAMQAATQNDDKKDAHSNVAQGNTVTPATTPFSTPRRHNNNLSQEVRCIPKPPRLNVVPSSARTIASGFPSLAPPGVSKVSEETEVMKKPYESRTNSIDGINGFEKELSPFPVKPPLFSVQGSHNSQAGICAKTSLYSRGSARDTELKRLRQQYKEELDKSATLLSMLTNAQQRIHLYEDIVCQRLLTPENKSPTPVFRDGTGYDTENGGKKTMLEWWMLLPFFPDLKYEGREDNEVLRDVAIRLAEQQHSLARIKVSVSPPPCLPSMYDGSEDNDSSFCRVLVPPELRGNMTFSDGKHYTLRS